MDMTTNTLERPTSEQVSQLSRADLEWLDSIGSFLLPAQELSVDVAAEAPDQLYFLDFSPVDNPSVLSGPKPKEKVTDLAYTETYHPKWLSPERRRKLGENLCHWAGVAPLTADQLEQIQAKEVARRSLTVNEQELIGPRIQGLIECIPENFCKIGRTALLSTGLLMTALSSSGVVSINSAEPRELQLSADSLPELIMNHSNITVDNSAKETLSHLLVEEEKISAIPADVAEGALTPSKPQLMETIVSIADQGNSVTLETMEKVVPAPAEQAANVE